MSPQATPHTSRLILVLGLAAFSGALSARATDPFVAALATEFQSTPDEAALLASAFTLPFALIQPILGPVGDALGKRRIIRVALAALGVLTLAAAFVPSLGALMVLRGLAGAAAGGVMPLTLAAVADVVPPKDRQVALSRLVAFAIGGQIAGGALAGGLAEALGWRGVLILCGVVALCGAAVVTFGLAGQPREPRSRFDLIRAFGRYRFILGLAAARKLYIAVLIEGVLVFGCFPWFAPVLEARGLGSTGEAGLAVAAFGAGGVLYAVGSRRILAAIGQGRMVLLGGALGLVGLLGFAGAPLGAVFVAAALVLGLGFYMVHNTIQTRATELAPEARGSAVALHAFFFYVGQSLGPVFIGGVGASFGMPAALALAGVGFALLGLWLGGLRNRP